MQPTQLFESYKFGDIVTLWGKELLQHDFLIAKALAAGVVRDGLRLQSRDAKWVKAGDELRGEPYVGFSADSYQRPVIIKARVLEHLQNVVRTSADVSRDLLWQEFVTKTDFKDWLFSTHQPLPSFRFSEHDRDASFTTTSNRRVL